MRTRVAFGVLVAMLVAAGGGTARAGNGLIPIGFGTESVAMGGADVAVARDTSAMNTNPAGLTRLGGRRLDLYGGASAFLERRHRDAFGNDRETSLKYFGGGTGAFATRLGDRPVWLGAGLFAQSGAGSEFRGLTTAFGTTDDLISLYQTVRLNLGAAWRASPTLAVGASLGVSHSELRARLFPNTSSASPLFFGEDLKGASGTGLGVTLGVLYRPRPRHTFGLGYVSRVAIPVKGGRLITDQSAAGLGTVTYRDARIDGLRLPRTVSLGYALQARPDLLVSLEGSWIDWSGALRTTTLTASGPDNPGAAPVLQVPEVHDWHDQYVAALGLAWDATDRMTLYAGGNHGRNPVPSAHTDPTLPGFTEDHLTGGARLRIGDRWWLYGALEYGLRKTVTYTNPALPFGPGAQETGEYVTLHATLSRLW